VSSAPDHHQRRHLMSGSDSITRASRWVSMRAARGGRGRSVPRGWLTPERSRLADFSRAEAFRSKRSPVSCARLFQTSRASSFFEAGPSIDDQERAHPVGNAAR